MRQVWVDWLFLDRRDVAALASPVARFPSNACPEDRTRREEVDHAAPQARGTGSCDCLAAAGRPFRRDHAAGCRRWESVGRRVGGEVGGRRGGCGPNPSLGYVTRRAPRLGSSRASHFICRFPVMAIGDWRRPIPGGNPCRASREGVRVECRRERWSAGHSYPVCGNPYLGRMNHNLTLVQLAHRSCLLGALTRTKWRDGGMRLVVLRFYSEGHVTIKPSLPLDSPSRLPRPGLPRPHIPRLLT